MNEAQKRDFLRNLLEMRESMKNTKKQQELKKMVEETFQGKFAGKSSTDHLHDKIVELQDSGLLPYIEIPHVMHTKDHGNLVFLIDKKKGKIKIMKRVYQWDSEKDNIDDE